MRDEKSGLFYEQKSAGRRPLPRGTSSNAVAGTTDKLFWEGKRPDFFIESRDSTGDFGLKLVGSDTKERPPAQGNALTEFRRLGSFLNPEDL